MTDTPLTFCKPTSRLRVEPRAQLGVPPHTGPLSTREAPHPSQAVRLIDASCYVYILTYPVSPTRSLLEGVTADPHLWWEGVSDTERDAVEGLTPGGAEKIRGSITHHFPNSQWHRAVPARKPGCSDLNSNGRRRQPQPSHKIHATLKLPPPPQLHLFPGMETTVILNQLLNVLPSLPPLR